MNPIAKAVAAALVAGSLMSLPSIAQEAGGIRGKVTAEAAGSTVGGITVTATSDFISPFLRTCLSAYVL